MGRLTEIRKAISLLAKFPPLVSLIATDSRFQTWADGREILGDMKDNQSLGMRLQLVPEEGQKNYRWSNSAAAFRRTFMLEVYSGKLDIEMLETLEEHVENAGAYLMAGLSPVDGQPLTIHEDVVLIGISVEGSDPDREPTEDEDSEEWMQALRISVEYTVAHSSMMVLA